MALLKRPIVRTSQPSDLCGLSDWAKDRGFRVALTPKTMWAGAQSVKRFGGVGNPGLSTVKLGQVRTYSSTSDFYADGGTLDPRGGYVFAFYGYFSAVGTWSGLFARTSNTSTGQGLGWQRVGATDALVCYHDGGSGGLLGTLNGYLDSVPRMWVMGWDAVTKYASLYRDGELVASVYYNVTPTYAGPGLLKIAASRDTSLTSGGCALAAAAINTSPSQQLATDLYQNPWRLFEPVQSSLWAPGNVTAAGAQLSGTGSAVTAASAEISSAATVVGSGIGQTDKSGAVSSSTVLLANAAAVTSSSAALTVTVPGATIAASGTAVTDASSAIRSPGTVIGAGASVTSGAATVTAGTSAAAIAGTGAAVPSGSGAVKAGSSLAAANAASTLATAALGSSASLSGAAQARTSSTAAITAGSSSSAAIVATSDAVTQAVAALIAQCTVAATGAAVTSGMAALSTGSPGVSGELILSELKIATITISALKFASIDIEVLNNG